MNINCGSGEWAVGSGGNQLRFWLLHFPTPYSLLPIPLSYGC